MKDLCGLKDSTKDLIERAHNNDKEAREKLILDNMGLIGSIVKDLKDGELTGMTCFRLEV